MKLALPGDVAIPGTPRQRAYALAAVALLMLLSFATGRFLAPTRVVEHTRTVHDSITVDASGTKTGDATGTAVDHTVEETHRPDGTVTVVKHDVVYRDVVHTVDVVHTQVVHDRVENDRSTEISRPAPSWRVGLLAGLTSSSSRFPISPAVGLPVFVPLTAGVSVERRIAGPVWGGAWATTEKSAGLSLSITF